MKKIMFLLVFLSLIVNVNAACTPYYASCSSSNECCNGHGYDTGFCYGGTNPVCRAQPAKINVVCIDDGSCAANLVCPLLDNGKRCSECRPNEKTDGNLEWDWTSIHALPEDRVCLESTSQCICDYVRSNEYDGIRYLDYARWLRAGAEYSIGCSTDDECWEDDNYCQMTQDNGDTICVDSLSKNCNIDSHCNNGYYCKNHRCSLLDATTTTAAATTTTTLPYQVTTTTLVKDSYGCGYFINVSSSADDKYNAVDNAGLILYDQSEDDNNLLTLVFRNFPIGFNVDSINAQLFFYSKYIPPETFNFTYKEDYAYDGETELGLNGSYYNLYSGFNQNFLRPNKPSIPPLDTGFPAIGIANAEGVIVDNDTWFSVNVSENLFNQLKYHRDNALYRYNNNITLNFNTTLGSLTGDVEVYSYDDDPTLAPRLCIVSAEYQTDFNECTIDSDCINADLYCNTYDSDANRCMPKKEDYSINYMDSLCYRNHECLSGICSEHNDNSAGGDYPSYSIYGRPYIAEGDCLPSPYKMTMAVSPEILGKDDIFKLWLATENLNGEKFYPEECHFYFKDFTYLGIYETNYSWAFSNESVNNINAAGGYWHSYWANFSHSMRELSSQEELNSRWTYTSSYPLFINPELDFGIYDILAECTLDGGLTSVGRISVEVLNDSLTSIDYINKPSYSVRKGTDGLFRLRYLDYQKKPLSDSDCILRFLGNNYTLTEVGVTSNSQYETTITFNETGQHTVDIWCNLTGYDNVEQTATYLVLEDHCTNGVMDSDETGLDCGGECRPCDDDLKDPFSDCSSDSQCVTGYCDMVYFKCLTPTCYDGVKNNGEFKIDCGGVNCDPCNTCLYDSDCSINGNSWCNKTAEYQCQYQTCTTDADCRILEWVNEFNGGIDLRQTTCDTDGYCKFSSETNINQTVKDISLRVSPLSGVQVNKSGTIFSVFNCDDGLNGFELTTNELTSIRYNFVSSSYSPSIPLSYIPYTFGEDGTKTKKALITELCESNEDAIGGLGADEPHKYSKINFKVCSGDKCINQYVDVVTFKKSLENSLTVLPDSSRTVRGSVFWHINATNRSIQVWARLTPTQEWVNITTGHSANVWFNQSAIRDELEVLGSFQLLINTSFNEKFTFKNTDSLPLILQWDTETKWFKINPNVFVFEGWMLYIIIAFIIVLAAYYNYKSRRLGGV